jgi:hypothetical protein
MRRFDNQTVIVTDVTRAEDLHALEAAGERLGAIDVFVPTQALLSQPRSRTSCS